MASFSVAGFICRGCEEPVDEKVKTCKVRQMKTEEKVKITVTKR